MELSTDKLRAVVAEAFDLGYHNSAELKDQLIDELITRCMVKEEPQYRIFKVAELKQMPVGALFQHSTRGRCWIEAKPDGTKQMRFENPGAKSDAGKEERSGKTVSLSTDDEPWDRPMRLLHKES
jgi:hypothetical protein